MRLLQGYGLLCCREKSGGNIFNWLAGFAEQKKGLILMQIFHRLAEPKLERPNVCVYNTSSCLSFARICVFNLSLEFSGM